MEFHHSYRGDSSVNNSANQTSMSFAPDASRQPTFFRGQLLKSIEFREAISALHDVVVSDLRWQPKDRSEYLAWAAQQEEIDWAEVASRSANLKAKIEATRRKLDELRSRSRERMSGFEAAKQKYFQYLYKRDYDAWFVLDPVITVHPDEVFFECFSQDESSYGRLSTGFEVFQNVGEFSCGTTNIDYSAALYDEFQKIRQYKTTEFEVDPSGFEVQTTGEASYKEVKIDLPDSWVRGFLQVSSAMALPSHCFDLHPMDIYNICRILRRNKELKGPRSLRYQLKPGEPVQICFDPWGTILTCPRSVYRGDQETEIRVWGRRRIHILERLIPLARRFTVHLLGSGMPTFYVADLGDMAFTLGLSGWTTNDWSASGNFDLLAPRAQVDHDTKTRIFSALKENWFETPDSLASRLNLERSIVLGALSAYTQAGRAIWDLNKQVYRVRELTGEPLPMEKLRFENEREREANELAEAGAVAGIRYDTDQQGFTQVTGTVMIDGRPHTPNLRIDVDQRLVDGDCTCNWYQQNRFRKGPCVCMLALRKEVARRSQPGLLTRLAGAL
ncbi:MAG: hypothetical protein MI861_04275 [Pirellulales bacterium]|nr:hypothetical protein [Pirellulales bacterium]